VQSHHETAFAAHIRVWGNTSCPPNLPRQRICATSSTYLPALYCLGKVYYTAWEPQLLLIVVKVLGGVRCTEEQKLKQEIISDSRSDQVFHWREGSPQTPGRKQLTQRGVV
jgi:hypothetical protein